MLVALAVLAALETATPPTVELSLTGAAGTPVSASPRTLSDVARERREGRRAVGCFSAVETTVSRGRVVFPSLAPDEEEENPGPEVVPGPEPPEVVMPYGSIWNGGWWGGAPARPRPHVHPVVHAAPNAGRSPSPRAAARPSVRPFAHNAGFATRGARARP